MTTTLKSRSVLGKLSCCLVVLIVVYVFSASAITATHSRSQPVTTTQQDDRIGAAQKLFEEGQQLLAVGTAPYHQAAVEKFLEAATLWRALADKRREAIALSFVGKIYDLLGEKQQAISYYTRTLALVRLVKDQASEAATLNNLGLVFDSLGEKQKALEHYNIALLILEQTGNTRVRAITMVNIGLLHDSIGEKQRALEFYQRALPLLRAERDRRAEAITFNNIGYLYDSIGDQQKALSYFNRALPILQEIGDRRVEAITLNNVGYVYDNMDEEDAALDYYQRALPVLRIVGDRRMEAVTLNNIGLVYKAKNDQTRALNFLNQALERRRAVGDRAGEGTTISDIGSVYAQLGQTDKALNFYQQAIQLSRDVQDRNTEASTLRRLALLERDRGNLQNARTYLETSLSIIEHLRTKIVGQELRSSYFASTHEFFDSYIEVLMRLHTLNPDQGLDGLALEASERSRARALLDSLVEAKANIREGIDPVLLERERSLQKRLNDIAEREARSVGSTKTDQPLGSVKTETESILTDYEEVEAEIRAKSPRFAALMHPVPLSLKQIQEQIIDADTLLLEYSLASERSYVWAVTSNSISSFELPPHAKIDTAARQLYASLTARNKLVRFEKLAEQRARIAKADADYISASAELSQMLLGPVASLLGKRRLLIVADGSLNYLPFAALPVPSVAVNEFAPELTARRVNRQSVRDNPKALSRATDKFKPLIVDHEVVSLPSASALSSLRLELRGRSPAPKTLAVLADPVFEKNDERFRNDRSVKKPRRRSFELSGGDQTDNYSLLSTRQESVQPLQIQRLPFTRREADEILSLVPENESFAALGFDANRTTATSPLLGQYKYVHFATHGFLNAARPELTGMVLSLVNNKGIDQNGFLWAHEIYNLRLPAEMVVLSGCRTGLGKEIKGEGLVGLTRGFMYAGASRVIVSLWAVSDEASAELMGNLYKAMLKENLSPSAALRSAQLAVFNQKRWESPYYWAAFVLQGEPR